MAGLSYAFDGNTETPQDVARRRALAEAIMGRTISPQNVGEGFGAIASGIVANVNEGRAREAEQAGRESANSTFSSLISGLTGGAPGYSPAQAPQSGSGTPGSAPDYRTAIASIESAGSGDYGAVGPTDPELGRALGRYQIMEANIGPWSREALGREVTPEEFMASPEIQDAIFDHQFGNYVTQYGPEGAAQAWFGGPGGVGQLDRRDSLGTSIGDYTDQFNTAMGGQPQMAQGPSLEDLLMASQNPWLTDGQRSILNTMIEQQMAGPAQPEYDFMNVDGELVRTDATGGGVQSMGQFGTTEAGFTQLNAEQVASMNLDPQKAWQQGPDGRIYEVGGSGVTVNNNMGDSLTPGWEAIDKGFAETYLSWIGNDSADTQAQLENLNNALSILGQEGGAETGTLVSALPRAAQAFLNSEGLIARENVEETVQRSLRATLGAQFTEREGERLIQRAFNPLLPTEENVRRVNLLVGKIQEMARAKDEMVRYFQQNGTLMGYEGQTPSMNNLLDVEAQFGADPQGNSQPAQSQPSNEISEGTVIENDAGQQMVLRNGQWVEVM